MSERVCPSCRYRVLSAVGRQCPNCGAEMPVPAGSNAAPTVAMMALLIGIAGGVVWFIDRGYREATPVPTTVSTAPLPMPRPSPSARTVPGTARPGAPGSPAVADGASPLDGAARAEAARLRGQLADPDAAVREAAARRLGEMRDPQAVPALVRLLADEDARWQAAKALGRIGSPEADRVLMAAYDRRDYAVMSGAHAFYLARRPPQFEKVLVDLLRSENDLAIAQTLILSRNPRLAGPAQAWAAEKGWALVPDAGSPGGVTWKEVAPQPPRR